VEEAVAVVAGGAGVGVADVPVRTTIAPSDRCAVRIPPGRNGDPGIKKP